jgi:hypothetical protein
VKDRLFYFLFADYEDADRLRYYTFSRGGEAVLVDRDETTQPYWGGKIDWNLSEGHRIEATHFADRVDVDFTRWQYDPVSDSLGDARGSGVLERGGDNFILKYSGVLGARALLSLQAGGMSSPH